MARKSRWANFAESFSGTYGALNSAFRNIQMGRAMSADYNDDEGNALTGDALDRARYRALADIETRYGRAAEGLALRSNQAALQATNFENDLNVELRPELLRQRGVLQSGLMEAQTSQANASAANSYSLANERDTLLPGRVEAQGLTNAGLGLSNAQAEFDLGLARETRTASVEAANAAARQASADARLAGANADVAEGTVGSRIGTGLATQRREEAAALDAETTAAANVEIQPARTEATISELRAQAAESANREVTAETLARDNSIVADIMSQALERDFGDDPAAANAWIVDQLATADMTPAGRLRAAETVNKFGIEAIGSRAAQITQQANEAYRTGGIDGVADLYDNVNDGVDGRVVRDGDRVSIVVDRGNGQEVVATATGPDAERVVATQAMQIFRDPMRAMEMAAATLEYETGQAGLAQTTAETDRTRAQTSLIDEQLFSEQLDQDRTRAQTALLMAQTDQTNQAIEVARRAGNPNEQALKEIALRGLTNMVNDVNFGSLDPDEQDAMIARYRAEFGLGGIGFEGWSFEVVD
jgi:hypothetical protein